GRVLSGAAAVHYTCAEEQHAGAMVSSATRPVIIPNPVDFHLDRERLPVNWLRSRYPSLAGKIIILFLSRLHPGKGIDLLLASFAHLRDQFPNIALVLAGSGEADFTCQIRRQASALGIEPDVVWAGFLEDEAKQAALSEADIFVLPSYSENFGVA